MNIQVKKEAHIRLADGRTATLGTIELPNGLFITMVFSDGIVRKKILSKKTKDEALALYHFEYYKEELHVPELTGKYAKLAADLKEAADYSRKMMGTDDSGSFNFDSTYIRLPRWRQRLVIAATKSAGLLCYKMGHRSSYYSLSIPDSGYCSRQTRAAEAMRDYLQGLGYEVGVSYRLD